MTDEFHVEIKQEPDDSDEDETPNFFIDITPLPLEEPHRNEEDPFAIKQIPGEWNLARHLHPPLPPPIRVPIDIKYEPPKLDFTQPPENITVKIEPFDILEPSERLTQDHIKQEKIIEQYIDHRKNTKKRLCEQKIVINPSVKLLNRESRPFVCIECGLSFIRNADLNVHFRTHSGEKPFACPQCDLKFTQKGNLKRHIQTHTGLKPFECHDCEMKFAQKSLLQMHWRTHSGVRPFQCSQCGQKFTTKSLVITHFRTHTGERPYACNECGKKFAQKHTLDCHTRIHSGEKPYECNVCNKRFRFRNTCMNHAKTHSDVKAFGCDICGTSYKNKSTLRKHQIKNHPKKSGSKQRTRKRTKKMQKYSLDYDANGIGVTKGMISDDRNVDLNLGECRQNL